MKDGIRSTSAPLPAEWDVLVIGAGPAGALAARGLALRGLSVLLVEQKSFPRAKVCGCCLNARVQRVLRGAGLPDFLQQHGAQALETIEFRARGRRIELPLRGELVLSRSALDEGLARAAVEAGATFLPSTRAQIDALDGAARRVVLQGDHGSETITARVVIAAAGLRAPCFERAHGPRLVVSPRSRLGAASQLPVHTLVNQEPWPAGRVLMCVGRGGYVGVVRLEDDSLNLAAALDATEVRRLGGAGPAAARILTEAGWNSDGDIAAAHWHGVPNLTCRAAKFADERVFLVGDAAGYVEPFTGEGIAWAMESAEALAPLAAAAVQQWTPQLVQAWQRKYRRLILHKQVLSRYLTWALRSPAVVAGLMTTIGWVPGLTAPIVRSINRSAACEEVST